MDEAKCSSFFSFNLLYKSAANKDGLTATGIAAVGETEIAFNKSFPASATFTLTNQSDNAIYFAWLSLNADGTPGGQGIEVKAGETHHFNRSQLGNEDATFLLFHNLSNANPVSYKTEVKYDE